jgi:hypothetical protein
MQIVVGQTLTKNKKILLQENQLSADFPFQITALQWTRA